MYTTLKQYKAAFERLKRQHNRDCEAVHKGKLTDRQHLLRFAAREGEERRLEVLLQHDEKLRPHLLDTTIYYQAGPEGNHALGDRLAQEFPQGKSDCESSQGYFYVSNVFLRDVLAFLKDRATNVTTAKSVSVMVK